MDGGDVASTALWAFCITGTRSQESCIAVTIYIMENGKVHSKKLGLVNEVFDAGHLGL